MIAALVLLSSVGCSDLVKECVAACTGNDTSVSCADATLKFDKIMVSKVRHASEMWCDYVGCLKKIIDDHPTCDLGTEPLCANYPTTDTNKLSCSLEYDKCHSWSCTVNKYDLVINCLLTQDCIVADPDGINTCSPTCHSDIYEKCQQTHSCGTHSDVDECTLDPLFHQCNNTAQICQAMLSEATVPEEDGGGLASWIVIALLISGVTFFVLTGTIFIIVRSWKRSKVLPGAGIETKTDEMKEVNEGHKQIEIPENHGGGYPGDDDHMLGVNSRKALIESVTSDFVDTAASSVAQPVPPPPSEEVVTLVDSIPAGSNNAPKSVVSNVVSVTPSKISFNIASTVASVPPTQSIPVVGSMLESIPNPFSGGTLESQPPASMVSSVLASSSAATKPSMGDISDVSTNQLSKWHKAHLIGKGSFGEVYLGILTSGCFVAVKVVDLGKNLHSTEVEDLLKEVQLMRRFKHKNITRYLDSGYDPAALKLHIFMEFVDGGSLSALVKKLAPAKLDDLLAARYTKQILEGLQYLHEECHTIHRDIKGENVLIRNDGVVKLADFGCSKQMQSVAMKTRGCETMVGTPYWMAPEVISVKEGQVYGFASDVWSVGCTVSEMLNRGEPPWPIFPSMWAAIYNIGGAEGLPTNLPQDCSPLATSFMVSCLVKDPKERPIVATLLSHEWVAGIDVAAAGLPAPGSLFATDSSNHVDDSMRTAESALDTTLKDEGTDDKKETG